MTTVIEGKYVIINNIPKEYHASCLRNFFSSFVESGGFICFHYRHRPEIQKPIDIPSNLDQSRRVTNCCVIKVVSDRLDDFVKQYNGEHWLDNKGNTLMTCCFIKKIAFSYVSYPLHSSLSSQSYKQGSVFTNIPLDKEDLSVEEVNSLIEMNPPSFMPNGNVGTKTSHFLNEIKACRLRPSLITKLGLLFPRNRSRRIYGNVPFEYQSRSKRTLGSTITFSKNKFFSNNRSSYNKSWYFWKSEVSPKQDESVSEEESEEEEWDRYESLHEDVSGQERNKEKPFEEEIELQWEKGGSGLVFYTDAQYWDTKEGDFDAKTSDDWDIDTSVYSNPGPGTDKDMRDLIQMKLEKRLGKESEAREDRLYDFAVFEKYNKGFGRKLMESQGWKQGQGIGKKAGISEPISNEGQLPDDKKGFGYRGKKLNPHLAKEKRKRKRRHTDETEHFHISTIYDNPVISDPLESILVSTSFSKLKYRKEFLKEHSCDT